ncbi:S1 family peptidase [Micromonospora sp. NPDC006431]|uniref:S1 family peptidase n=1 Tax=Micromonospora sp. NPDC006431 TaxID=3364235 RepID=UPI003675CF14
MIRSSLKAGSHAATTDRRTPSGRAIAAAGAAGLLVAALLVPAAAQAAPTAAADLPDAAAALSNKGQKAQALVGSLGKARTGGVYLNDSGQLVVAVTDQAAAQSVRAAGGEAELVTYSTATLESVHTALDKLAGIPGTSWGVDPSTNQVSVELDSTVNPANTARLKGATDKFGGAVRVERISGKITKDEIYMSGGDSIRNTYSSLYCSIGFNVATSSGNRHFLTAGHCAEGTQNWYDTASGLYLGNRVAVSWPGNDWADIDYTPDYVTAYGNVDNGAQDIASSRYPYDGESVSRVGATSKDLVGQVLLTSTTVTYSSGETLYGMIKTSLCGKGGDSGGPVYHGSVALGIHSGSNTGDDPCNTNVSDKRAYHQPVQEVLNARGLHVY